VSSWREMRWSARSDRASTDRMRSIWLLSGCTTDEIRKIRSLSTPLDVPEGKTLVRQGETCSQFFIVARGTAVVSFDHRPVALIEAGSFFGDMALFGRGAHRATVISATPMALLVLSRQECASLMTLPIPSVHAKIDEVLRERSEALAALARHPEVPSPLDHLSDLPALHQATT
jgi:CRP-like cAMP-binding protein